MGSVKVTLTLAEELLTAIDQHVASHPGATRSGLCAEAVRGWLQAQQDAEIERYYQTLSEEERKEDAAWASFAVHRASALWP